MPTLITAYSDPDVQRWHCRSLDADEAVSLVLGWRDAWDAESGASWAVTDRRSRVLGRVGFRVMHLRNGVAEVSYWVLPAARGRGVATAAVKVLTRWAFDDVGLQRLELMHSVQNAPSCRVAAASGFRPRARCGPRCSTPTAGTTCTCMPACAPTSAVDVDPRRATRRPGMLT